MSNFHPVVVRGRVTQLKVDEKLFFNEGVISILKYMRRNRFQRNFVHWPKVVLMLVFRLCIIFL